MPGPGTTSSAKSAPIVKQGQTASAYGNDPAVKGKIPPTRDLSPKS